MTVLPLVSLEALEGELAAAQEHLAACLERHEKARGHAEWKRTLGELDAAYDAFRLATERFDAVRSPAARQAHEGVAAMNTCQGCGAELPPNKAVGRKRKWCSNRCRKQTLYTGTCIDCGGPTGYSGTSVPRDRCVPCAGVHIRETGSKKVWPRPALIAAIQGWAEVYGEPPATPDWCPHHARLLKDEERARRFEEGEGAWPTFMTVVREFGTWNAGIAAAGFTPRARHGGGGNELRRRYARERVAA